MTMTELRTAADVQAFLDRFSQFFDAVLVEVQLMLPRTAGARRGAIRLLAQEAPMGEQEGQWRSVVLHVTGLSEFKFIEGQISNLVLSDGLNIHLLDGRCFIDLAPYTDQPVDESLLWRSGQYLVGSACTFEVSDT
jgi:hypothetical protein